MSQQKQSAATYDPVIAIFEPSLRVGAASGGAGFLVGGTAGIVRSATPTLFAIASSIQCAALGSTFWATRGLILHASSESIPATHSPWILTQASCLAGAVTGGSLALIFRGPRNVIPGIICIGAFGAGGQMLSNVYHREKPANKNTQSFWKSLLKKDWSPVRLMSDEEYANMLRERLLKTEVEIAVLDDKIAALKKSEVEVHSAQKGAGQDSRSD